jgi:hypothetical protein
VGGDYIKRFLGFRLPVTVFWSKSEKLEYLCLSPINSICIERASLGHYKTSITIEIDHRIAEKIARQKIPSVGWPTPFFKNSKK